ncbi:hypothetical protein ASD03_26995 [Ensifer sp. Root127]|nr:hypothetical protein ASD03_26995 [Ensifer sp. Root127]
MLRAENGDIARAITDHSNECQLKSDDLISKDILPITQRLDRRAGHSRCKSVAEILIVVA